VNKRTGLIFTLIFAATSALAQQSRQPQAAADDRGSNKPKTIGDILNKIEKKSEKVNFQKGQSSLPKFQQQAAPTQPNVDLKAVKPPNSNRLYYEEGTDEAELERATDEGINQLFKLSEQYKKSPKRGELWLRLAEQYVDKARLIEYRIMNQHDQALEAYQAGKTKVKPSLNLTASKEYNKKAVQLYEWFVRDFPKDPKIDQALFFLGFNFFELGDSKKGETYYVRLTKEFPNSLYVSESNFALGEFHFENERYKPALAYYSKVAEQKSNRLYSFAMYKIAWCYYKMNQSRTGLKYLEQVVLEGRRSKGQKDKSIGGVSRIRLATEAIKDLIVFFAEAGDPKMARSYFGTVIGEKSTNANLAKLSYFYLDTGNRPAARYLFKDLIDQEPNSVKAYDYQYAIVKSYSASGDPKIFKEELYAWIQSYGPASSWQKTNQSDKEAVKKANDLMESLLRNHVLLQHQNAQTARTKTAIANAKNGYELYFTTFQDGPKIDEMHFFYGELLFDLTDFERAAVHYTWVVDNAPKSTYYDKALLNSLLSYEKKLPAEDKIRKIVGTSTAPVEFDANIVAFEKAAKRYLEHSPNGENAVAVKYRLASLYYLFNHFDDSIPLLTEIIKKYPKTPYAKFAANHLLDIYNLKKDYVGLQNAANQILSVPELAHSEVGNQVREVKLKTDFKLAKDLEDKKDYAGSAKAYENFASHNKASDLAVPAQFNAAVNYERAGQVATAILLYSALSDSKGKIPADMKQKSSQFLPVLYEKTGQYAKAAHAFEAYANANPKDKLSVEYRYNAAVIYDGMNLFGPAMKNYNTYFDEKKSRDKIEVLFLIAKLYERQGQLDRAIAAYDKYLSNGPSNKAGVVEATYTVAKLHEKLHRKKPVEEWFQKTVAVQRRLTSADHPIGASYAAEAKLKLIHPLYDDLVSIRIPQNPKNQAAAVTKKLATLEQLKNQLKAVVAYDDGAQIVAALTLQGEALQNVYESFITAPLPKGLNADEMKQYKALLSEKAEPFKKQAIEVYETAVSRGHELQAYTSDLAVALRNTSHLKGEANMGYGTKALLTKLPDTMGL